MNDLATLLAPDPHQHLANDISAATLHSQRLLKKELTKETWIQKLRKGSNIHSDLKDYKNRGSLMHAIGATDGMSGARLTKETSYNTLNG